MLGYHPGLDGVRGIAVLLVVLLHTGDFLWLDAEPWLAQGGSLGVDMFLVLSGFLITALLLTELGRTGRIRLGAFAVRRVRRLIPALVALHLALMVVVVAGTRLVARDVAASAVSVMTFTGNAWGSGPAPGLDALVDWIGSPVREVSHTWTLSVEVQFYALWAVALWLTTRLRWSSHRLLFLVATLVAAAVTLMRIVRMELRSDGPGTMVQLYFTTAGRLDAPMVGAMAGVAWCAGWLDRLPRRLVIWAGVAGGAGLLAAAFGLEELDTPAIYYGLYTALAVGCAAVVVGVVQAPDSPLSRLLAWRPLRWLGLVSYSVYLVHFGLFMAIRRNYPDAGGPVAVAVGIPLALLLGWLSYRLVERPWLSRRPTLAPAGPAPALQLP